MAITVDIGSNFGSPFGTQFGLGKLVSVIITNALVLAGIILLFYFVLGGISMLVGAGQDNPEKAAKGKQAATSAGIGFIIIFASYWIIRLIEALTGVAIINPTL